MKNNIQAATYNIIFRKGLKTAEEKKNIQAGAKLKKACLFWSCYFERSNFVNVTGRIHKKMHHFSVAVSLNRSSYFGGAVLTPLQVRAASGIDQQSTLHPCCLV